MGRHLLAAGTAAAACAWPLSAQSRVGTSIAVTDLRVSVSAIAPGHAPAVAFSNAGGSSAESDASSGDPPSTEAVTFSSGAAFGQAATVTSGNPFVGGSASLVGDVFGDGGAVHTSAWTRSVGPDATGQGTVGLVDGMSAASFTLAPWTRMTITATVSAFVSVTGGSADEFADSGLSMAVADDQGAGLQFTRIDFDAFAWGQFGPVDDVENTVVRLAYENDTDADLSGLFSGNVSSIAYADQALSAVPEPGCPALLVAGLAVLAAAARRRAMKKAGMSRP